MRKVIACVSGFIGFMLIFGTAGKIEYTSMVNEMFTAKDAILQFVLGGIIMVPALVYLIQENRG